MTEPIEVTGKLLRQGNRTVVLSHVEGWSVENGALQVYVGHSWWGFGADSPELAQKAADELAVAFDPPPTRDRFEQKTMGGASMFFAQPPSQIRPAT